MKLVRRRSRPAMPISLVKESESEKWEKKIAKHIGGEVSGRAQKTKGNRLDIRLPTSGNAPSANFEVKCSDLHPYGKGGFRHNVSNLFGHGEGNDAEYYILQFTRQIPFDGRTQEDKKSFFLFFSRSQLRAICTGMLNLPANWEPGGARPKDRSNTAQKNAAICRAVISYGEIEKKKIRELMASNPNELNAPVKRKRRSTMKRVERELLELRAENKDLKRQRDDPQNLQYLHFLQGLAEDAYSPENRFARKAEGPPRLDARCIPVAS